MATTLHVFFPLSIALFLSLHLVEAHRKFNINKPPINQRALMSSSNFYNAFDTNYPNHPTFFNPNVNQESSHITYEDNANKESSHINLGDIANKESTHLNYEDINANKEINHINYEDINANKESNHINHKDNANKEITHFNYEDNANGFNDIVDKEFNTNSYTSSYSNNAHLPLSTTSNTQQQAHGLQYGYPTTSTPSSSSTPPLYGGKFPDSFQASLPDAVRNGYTSQKFPSNNQEGLYGSSSDAKSFSYNSPSKFDASPTKEQSLSQSPLSYGNSFHQFDDAKSNNQVSDYGFENEKPVANYDSFFNSPIIHKSEVEGLTTSSPFGQNNLPKSDHHDLTYGHVQVP